MLCCYSGSICYLWSFYSYAEVSKMTVKGIALDPISLVTANDKFLYWIEGNENTTIDWVLVEESYKDGVKLDWKTICCSVSKLSFFSGVERLYTWKFDYTYIIHLPSEKHFYFYRINNYARLQFHQRMFGYSFYFPLFTESTLSVIDLRLCAVFLYVIWVLLIPIEPKLTKYFLSYFVTFRCFFLSFLSTQQ